MAVRSTTNTGGEAAVQQVRVSAGEALVLLDSGSDEHVACEQFSVHSESVAGNGVALRDVQGRVITSGSGEARSVNFLLPLASGKSMPARATFQIGPVKGPVLSYGKLWRNGYRLGETKGGQPCLSYRNEEIVVHIIRSSLYVKVKLLDGVVAAASENTEKPNTEVPNTEEPITEKPKVVIDEPMPDKSDVEEHQKLGRSAPVLGPGSRVEELKGRLKKPEQIPSSGSRSTCDNEQANWSRPGNLSLEPHAWAGGPLGIRTGAA
eukprot:2533077-Amphidinium_carterae.2